MEKEIIWQITTQIDNLKDHQLLVIVILFIVFIIISVFEAVYTSRLIEKYRNQLKKTELKFSVFNELQISKLSEFYVVANDLKSGLVQILSSINQGEYLVSIDKWEIAYQEFKSFLSKNKYIIPREIKQLITESKYITLSEYDVNIQLTLKLDNLYSNRVNNISLEEKIKCQNLIEAELGDFSPRKATLEMMIIMESIKTCIEEYFENIE